MEKMLILSTIDDLNQYLNGNVTKEGLIESLDILKRNLTPSPYQSLLKQLEVF